jgi:two-component system, OmpR family, sensor kinase
VAAINNEPGEGFDKPGSGQHVAVVSPTGDVKLSTLPKILNTQLTSVLKADETRDFTAMNGTHYIVRAAYVKASDGDWRVVTARTANSEQTVLDQMRTLLIWGLVAVVVAVAVAAWLLTSASLTPVRRLRRTAERLSSAPSRELLPVGPANDDISGLAGTLNGLIEQLRDSADRERQLVSDASHELRTPLAILRAQLEVATRSPQSLERLVDDLQQVDRSADRLSRLLASLLELSRIEADASDARTPAAEVVAEAEAAADRAEIRLMPEAPVRLRAESDVSPEGRSALFALSADEVGRILDNLIGNALRAIGERDGSVLIGCTITGEDLTLAVTDDGGGMPEDFVEHALDRFRRDDDARSSDGAGLGLSIVAALARRAGGDVQLANRPGEGLTVRVRVPAIREAEED